MNLLEIDNLDVVYGQRTNRVAAVKGVSLAVARGETVGLVGESGSGKTSLANATMGLVPYSEGHIRFSGREVGTMTRLQLRTFRRCVQLVFQDPFDSLNARLQVGRALGEVLRVHGFSDGGTARQRRVSELLEMVGLQRSAAGCYPHELSGGQRQRVVIARALAVEPSLIIADEPVSALDVSVQARILALMSELQSKLGLTYLFIAHDLAVVRRMCDRVYVMYDGLVVESGTSSAIFEHAAHPYTLELIRATPRLDSGFLHDEPINDCARTADSLNRRGACAFFDRCRRGSDCCMTAPPRLLDLGEGHMCRCHKRP